MLNKLSYTKVLFVLILIASILVIIQIQKQKEIANFEEKFDAQKYCSDYKSGLKRTILDCGEFKVVRTNECCDMADIILDKNGKKLMVCGGFAEYSEECKTKFTPQNNCSKISCN